MANEKKAVLLTGIPGSGKSTLTRAFMEYVKIDVGGWEGDDFEFFKEGLVIGHKYGDLVVFGDYRDEKETFPGTDKMSMAVSPEFQEYVKKNSPTIFLEGDRLVGNKTIDFLLEQGYNLQVVHLKVPKDTIKERYVERGSDQDPQFLKSKETKVGNITSRMDLNMEGILIDANHVTPNDTKKIVSIIHDFYKG